MSERGLNPGESVNRTLVKVTVAGLFQLLDSTDGLGGPQNAWSRLKDTYGDEAWFQTLHNEAGEAKTWRDFYRQGSEALETADNLLSVLSVLPFS